MQAVADLQPCPYDVRYRHVDPDEAHAFLHGDCSELFRDLLDDEVRGELTVKEAIDEYVAHTA